MAHFPGHEGVHGAHQGAAREQVDSTAPELASAGTGEDEPVPAPGFHEMVNDVQELGDPLDFVDDHIGTGRRSADPFPQAFRASRQPPVLLRLEEIHHERVREDLAQPGGLACPPRAKEEEAAAATTLARPLHGRAGVSGQPS